MGILYGLLAVLLVVGFDAYVFTYQFPKNYNPVGIYAGAILFTLLMVSAGFMAAINLRNDLQELKPLLDEARRPPQAK